MKAIYRNTLLIAALLIAVNAAYANGDNRGQQQPSQQPAQAQQQFQAQSQRQFQQANAVNTTRVNAQSTNKNANSATSNPVINTSGGVVSGILSSNPVTGAVGNGTGGSAQAQAEGSGGNVLSSTYNQVKQAPMAWSPNMAMSMSPENCSNSVTFGASAGFGAISAGAPMDSDACNRRMDARMWVSLGQIRVACERMKKDDENAAALQAAGMTCASVTQSIQPVTQPISQPVIQTVPDNWAEAAKRRDAQLSLMQQRMKVKQH